MSKNKWNWVPLAVWISTSIIVLIGGAISYGESKALNAMAKEKNDDQDKRINELYINQNNLRLELEKSKNHKH